MTDDGACLFLDSPTPHHGEYSTSEQNDIADTISKSRQAESQVDRSFIANGDEVDLKYTDSQKPLEIRHTMAITINNYILCTSLELSLTSSGIKEDV